MVSLSPFFAHLFNTRIGDVLQSVREDLVCEFGAPSSRCQEGGRGKLSGILDTQTSRASRQNSLGP